MKQTFQIYESPKFTERQEKEIGLKLVCIQLQVKTCKT